MHTSLARQVRLRIFDRIRLIYHMPETPTVSKRFIIYSVAL